ncbi:MAG TPA: hypothetical protein PLO16_04990 [Acidocella sp.]|nr:hypothetical protein [Acidocella sp.]
MILRSITAAGLALIMALPLAKPAEAGAWDQTAGQGLLISSFSYYQVGVQGYNQFGRPTGKGTYIQEEFSPYLEYGLTDRWTIGLQPRLQAITQSGLPGTGHAYGLVQLNLFARYQIYRDDNNAFAAQGQIGVPGTASVRVPQLAMPSGEYEARLLYGHNLTLAGVPAYLDVEAAYRLESDGYADQIRGDATLGVTPFQNWQILAQSFNTISVGHAVPGQSDYDLYRVELSAVYSITKALAVQVGAWHDVGGRNIALGNAGVAALWWRF